MTECSSILSIGVNAAMLGVGASYVQGEDCKLQALLYLKVTGAFGLVMYIIQLLLQLLGRMDRNPTELVTESVSVTTTGNSTTTATTTVTRPSTMNNILSICSFVITIASMALFIWGSIIIFGPYNNWSYNDKSSDFFCEFTPYMFAFVVLIIGWSYTIYALIVYVCMASCTAIAYLSMKNHANEIRKVQGQVELT